MKKYELTDESKEFEGRTLRRIRYLVNSKYFCVGELGGWIESEDNLSQEGECCVLAFAKVFGNASVSEDAVIEGISIVKDNAQIMEKTWIHGHSIVGADTTISASRLSEIVDSHISFYSEAFDEPMISYNISGYVVIRDSIIQATGKIKTKTIENKELYGSLNMIY